MYRTLKKAWLKTFAVVGTVALAANPATAIEVGISPARFEVPVVSQGSTHAIRVFNIGSEPAELQVYVRTWTLDENNQVEIVEPTEQSLDQWILFNPSRFTVPPGESQTVRFAIRPRVEPEPGEHRAMLYFEEVPPEDTRASGVQTVGRVGVAVYGYVGDVTREGVLHSIDVTTANDTPTAVFDISSQGSAHVRMEGQYAIWSADAYPGATATETIANVNQPEAELPEGVFEAGFLPTTPVLPSHRRQVLLNLPTQLAPGRYVLDLNGALSGTTIDQGIRFEIKE